MYQITVDNVTYGISDGEVIVLENDMCILVDCKFLEFLRGTRNFSIRLENAQQEKELCDFLNALNDNYEWKSGNRLGYRYIIEDERVSYCYYYCRRADSLYDGFAITNSTSRRRNDDSTGVLLLG